MPEYIVEGEFSGYSRGVVVFKIKADSEEDAREYWYEGIEVGRQVVRDDTEIEITNVTPYVKEPVVIKVNKDTSDEN